MLLNESTNKLIVESYDSFEVKKMAPEQLTEWYEAPSEGFSTGVKDIRADIICSESNIGENKGFPANVLGVWDHAIEVYVP